MALSFSITGIFGFILSWATGNFENGQHALFLLRFLEYGGEGGNLLIPSIHCVTLQSVAKEATCKGLILFRIMLVFPLFNAGRRKALKPQI
jgi:hypothetical protein